MGRSVYSSIWSFYEDKTDQNERLSGLSLHQQSMRTKIDQEDLERSIEVLEAILIKHCVPFLLLCPIQKKEAAAILDIKVGSLDRSCREMKKAGLLSLEIRKKDEVVYIADQLKLDAIVRFINHI